MPEKEKRVRREKTANDNKETNKRAEEINLCLSFFMQLAGQITTSAAQEQKDNDNPAAVVTAAISTAGTATANSAAVSAEKQKNDNPENRTAVSVSMSPAGSMITSAAERSFAFVS